LTRTLLVPLSCGVLVLGLVPAAWAGTIKLGYFSQLERHDRAVIGARIHASQAAQTYRAEAGDRTLPHAHTSGQGTALPAHPVRGSAASLPNPFPPLAATAPVLRAVHPAGPGSFWYPDGSGHTCMYAPDSVLPCFTVVTAGGAPAAAAVSPAGIAASVARRLPLVPGEIEASPTRSGLTGAASWFWLDPAPQRRDLSVSLAGEAVTVVADPTVEWRFGDDVSVDGGPGVPYQSGAVPPEAVTHAYQTRCLPGDQGHDPYVLSSCGRDGYTVEALVVWRISYQAAGPVAESGTLPTRTTSSSVGYPVGEARAFLVAGGSS
jgi:hypothetical protein